MVYEYTVPRRPVAAAQPSPGPIYSLPSIFDRAKSRCNSQFSSAPSWKIGSKHSRERLAAAGPGPIYGVDSKLLRTGLSHSAKFSIHSRPNDPASMATPGPDLYFSEKATNKVSHHNSAPSYSICGKSRQFKTDQSPAPNSYDIKSSLGKVFDSSKKSAPAYSINGRKPLGSFNEDIRNTPGPNKYALPPNTTYKTKPPMYSLYGRTRLPGDNVLKPGPGAYQPEVLVTKKAVPNISFGIKHSTFASGFILRDDI